MSLISLLSIARSALLEQQRAMAVTSHNVANANTPGYTRQRLDLVSETPDQSPWGAIGRGVTDTGITRIRDAFLDISVRGDSGSLGNAQTRFDLLSTVNSALMEPSDSSIGAAFDGMMQSFADLANDPTSGPQRELTRAAAQRFVDQMHRVSGSIDQAQQEGISRLQSQVSDVNQLADQLAQLNNKIAGSGAANSPDLMDQRDNLIDQLSTYGSVQVTPQSDGSVNIRFGDVSLVEGGQSHSLSVVPVGGGWGVGTTPTGPAVNTGAGSLSALTDLVTHTLPGMKAQLDAFANAAVTQVNNLHRLGYTLNGSTGVDFFDPAGTTAGNIQLSAAVQGSTDQIAAASTAAPGDGNTALALSALGNQQILSLGGKTMREYYNGFAADIGAGVQNADQDVSVQQTLRDHDDGLRQSVGGVSVDEEMVNLIGQQQAYSAAAKIVTAADTMLQTLLNMTTATGA
ncbi:MAG TPA: flagellar hook-associated protein FlgK [Candidatus Sulfotelmatobacter sp.]|nr:flagellar hook-associated protein FlgK [Candidatus Sulfotelmatobacter sp.]